jgi:diguanylate cyclase (GGDEF)-like protein
MSSDSGDGKAKGGGIPAGALKTVVAQASPAKGTRTRGVLTVSAGSDAGRLISIPGGSVVTLGRSEECVARFDDVSLSRVHARVMRIGTDYVLSDAGSTNGTYVNDHRIGDAAQLSDGDRVQLGSATTLRFSLVDEAEERALRQVYEASMKDALTGVANRKHLEERLDAEIAYAIRQSTELSVVMIDVDFFKKVNDTYGHLAGDAVLRCVGDILGKHARTEDLAARYGGEEFVIVARGTTAAEACLLADRIRTHIAATPVVFDGKTIRVTNSAGVASLADCGENRDKATLLSCADGRLYKAKQQGRNRVIGPFY